MSVPQLLDQVRTARFARGIECPRCGGRVHRWGTFAGRQRYRCQRCRRTFSDLTGTPVAYLKKIGRIAEFTALMRKGLSVRRSAAVLAISPSTAFRWRHRLCAGMASHRAGLVGLTETIVLRLPASRKGERRLDRPPRRRRADRSRICDDVVCVLIAADRVGGLASTCAPRRRFEPLDLDRLFGTDPSTVLEVVGGEGRLGPMARYIVRRGGRFHDARRQPPGARPSLTGVRQYVPRWTAWLVRFRGVASKYLDHYLAWHRQLDAERRNDFCRSILRWPIPAGP